MFGGNFAVIAQGRIAYLSYRHDEPCGVCITTAVGATPAALDAVNLPLEGSARDILSHFVAFGKNDYAIRSI